MPLKLGTREYTYDAEKERRVLGYRPIVDLEGVLE